MSTKRDPSPYDCYAKLADDEPYFVLRAKDPNAPGFVEGWAAARLLQDGVTNPKIGEAMLIARAMREWRQSQVDQGKLPARGPLDQASAERSPDDEAHERPTLRDA